MNNQSDSVSEKEMAIQNIETIKTFLEKGRQNLEDGGFHFIFWGLLIPAATFIYLLIIIQTQPFMAKWFWPIIVLAGMTVSITAGIRQSKSKQTRSYLGRINGSLWTGFAIALLTLFVIIFRGPRPVTPNILSYTALMLGLVYWVHGSMLQLTWFRWTGLPWWISAGVMTALDWTAASMVMAATTFLCSFIPGVFLFRKNMKGKSDD